jgi:hypothetical protein
MLFLQALNVHYSTIVDQFRSCFKSLELATIDLVVEDIKYHDSFTVVDNKKDKKNPGPAGCILAAASVNVNRWGTVWNSPFDCLVKYGHRGIKTQWTHVLTGTGICPICHCDKKPWHIPPNCPLLKELNLKLVNGPPSLAPPAQGGSPAPAAPTPAPSPGGHAAATDGSTSTSTSGSGTASSRMTAALDPVVEYESDDDFCWAGDEEGLGSCGVCPLSKSNAYVAPYSSSTSCNHVHVKEIPHTLPSLVIPRSAVSSTLCIRFPKALHHLLGQMLQSLIVRTQSGSLVIADTGATDHMTPHKSAFISYKAIEKLQVRMGNNSYVPVLGRGTAIFSLSGQRILVRNVLHVPGLVVPLYSLCAHLKQCGCGFIGTFEAGMLVYFPTFVLSANTSTNCHLSYEPLSRSAPLPTLHYVQPRCAPNLYPSKVSPSTCMITPAPTLAIVEDDERSLMDAPQIPVHSSPALPLTPGGLSMDILSIAVQLWALADMVNLLMSSPLATSNRLPPSLHSSTSGSSPTTHDAPDVTLNHISLLLAMPQESIIKLLHHEGFKLPSIRLCDTANNSDTKTH